MFELLINNSTVLNNTLQISSKNIEEKVKLLIFRDLMRLNWSAQFYEDKIIVTPPEFYDKNIIKKSMSVKRNEIIKNNSVWISKNQHLIKENLASGLDVLASNIKPIIEVCETQKQRDIFRIFRYYWSSPYSEYVGRRIKLLIRDESLKNKPIIGIAALGSPIIHIPERDEWIGWDKETRTNNLNYTMDAYVIGALPPYNYLLGGKLISYILASKEVRKIYEKKYRNITSLISKRKYNKLLGLFTTSLYGKSSQYNRLKYNGEILYKPIGKTKGYGTLHLTNETFNAMIEFLASKNIYISNKFGSGPSWKMRVIHRAGQLLNFDPYFLLNHSFQRVIYFVPYAKNSVEILNGKEQKAKFYNYSLYELTDYWKKRWLKMRKSNLEIINKVIEFEPENFKII